MNVSVQGGNAPMSALRLKRTQMVSSTDMARRFAEYLDRATSSSESLFITKNNEIRAVLVSIEDFEWFSELEEIAEHLAIGKLVEARRNEPDVIDLESLLRREGLNPDELRRIDPE